jgi:hypothetical protein
MPLTMFKFLLYAFSLALLSHASGQQGVLANSPNPMRTCDQIAAAISRASQVFLPRERAILLFDLQ